MKHYENYAALIRSPCIKEGLEQYLSAGKSQSQEKELKQEIKQDAASDTKQKAAKEIKAPKQNTSHSKSKSVSH